MLLNRSHIAYINQLFSRISSIQWFKLLWQWDSEPSLVQLIRESNWVNTWKTGTWQTSIQPSFISRIQTDTTTIQRPIQYVVNAATIIHMTIISDHVSTCSTTNILKNIFYRRVYVINFLVKQVLLLVLGAYVKKIHDISFVHIQLTLDMFSEK